MIAIDGHRGGLAVTTRLILRCTNFPHGAAPLITAGDAPSPDRIGFESQVFDLTNISLLAVIWHGA
jgi:hypothetical protein